MRSRGRWIFIAVLAAGLVPAGMVMPASASAAESNGGVIGTNDVLENDNLSSAPSRLSALIDRITALRSVPGSIGDVVGAPASGTLVGAGSGRCLDVPIGTTVNGTPLVIGDCTAAANQVSTVR